MTHTLNTLPEELYDLIARSTADSDLTNLALVSKAWYLPARRCTMWTVWGSDSARRFLHLLTTRPTLAPLVRALVVDRVPHPRPKDSDGPADLLAAIAHDVARMAEAGFAIAGLGGGVQEAPGGAGKAESMQLLELAVELMARCPLLQRFFLLVLPGYWTNMMGTAEPGVVEEQQLRLIRAISKLDQLVVCGLWDEENIQPVQLTFTAFRRLLEWAPPRLRNISWPIEGPLEEGDLVWDGEDDDLQPLAASDQRFLHGAEADASPLPARSLTDVQLTLFHLRLAHYRLIARAVFPAVRRLVLDISASPNCIPEPDVMRELFADGHFADGLEWFSADVACLPETSNPLTLGVRPRFPCLCLNHDGGVYSVLGSGPLADSDRERFTALKENSAIKGGFVWKKKELEKVVGPLDVLLPGVQLIEV